eukprot:8273228-Alexandrium_andersonii.AAC.1
MCIRDRLTTTSGRGACKPFLCPPPRKIPPRAAIGKTGCKHGWATTGAVGGGRPALQPARWPGGRRR